MSGTPEPDHTPLTCGFGTPWMECVRAGGCRQCRREVARACADFDRDVFFGIHDRDGYKPGERRSQAVGA